MINSKNPPEIETAVLDIIAQRLGIPLNNITDETNLFDDLNASLLEKADIMQTLEEKYQIKFDAHVLKSLNTVSAIIDYLTENVD